MPFSVCFFTQFFNLPFSVWFSKQFFHWPFQLNIVLLWIAEQDIVSPMPSREGNASAERPTPPFRWMVLVASIWIQAFSANPYNYYSPTLKQVLNINQFQLNLLAVVKDFGEYAGILAGILFNKLPPWALLCIGALFAFLGYGSIWLVASGKFTSSPYVMVSPAFFSHVTLCCFSRSHALKLKAF